MRTLFGIIPSIALVLGGCSGGQEIGAARPPAAPTIAQLKNQIGSFDYLGPLWASTKMKGKTLRCAKPSSS